MTESEILCSKSHEFAYQKDEYFYIGVTDVLTSKLEQINKIDFPKIGEYYSKGEIFCFLEAENAAAEVLMPIGGKIEALNTKLIETPNMLNAPFSKENWLIKISSSVYEEDKKDLICYNKYKEGMD